MPTNRSLALATKLFTHLNTDAADQEARRMAADLLLEMSPQKPRQERLLADLKAWRLGVAQEAGRPAFYIFYDRTLEEIARLRPARHELIRISGVGPAKVKLYGDDLVRIISAHARA